MLLRRPVTGLPGAGGRSPRPGARTRCGCTSPSAMASMSACARNATQRATRQSPRSDSTVRLVSARRGLHCYAIKSWHARSSAAARARPDRRRARDGRGHSAAAHRIRARRAPAPGGGSRRSASRSGAAGRTTRPGRAGPSGPRRDEAERDGRPDEREDAAPEAEQPEEIRTQAEPGRAARDEKTGNARLSARLVVGVTPHKWPYRLFCRVSPTRL